MQILCICIKPSYIYIYKLGTVFKCVQYLCCCSYFQEIENFCLELNFFLNTSKRFCTSRFYFILFRFYTSFFKKIFSNICASTKATYLTLVANGNDYQHLRLASPIAGVTSIA